MLSILLTSSIGYAQVTVISFLDGELSWDDDIWLPSAPTSSSSVVLPANSDSLAILIEKPVSISDIQVGGSSGASVRLVVTDSQETAVGSLSLSYSNADVSRFLENSLLVLDSNSEKALDLSDGSVIFGAHSSFLWTRGSVSGSGSQGTSILLEELSTLAIGPLFDDQGDPTLRRLSATSCEVLGSATFTASTSLLGRDLLVDSSITELHVDNGCELTVSGSGSVELVDEACAGLFLWENSDIQLLEQASYTSNCPHTFIDGAWDIKDLSELQLSDTIIQMANSDLLVTNSGQALLSTSDLSFSDVTVRLSALGSLVLSNSAIEFDGSITASNTSSVQLNNGSEMEMSGNISVQESSQFTVSNSELITIGELFCLVPETITCYCNCNVTAAANVTCNAGTSEDSCLNTCLSTGVYCTGSDCTTWECEGYCEPSCPVGYVPTRATIELRDNGETTVEDFSALILEVGEVIISGSHQLFLLTDSEIEIFDGVFVAEDTSSVTLEDGSLEVAGGSLLFGGSSRLEGTNSSELEASLGTIRIEDSAYMALRSSSIVMTGGDVVLAGDAFLFTESVADFDPLLPWVDDEDVPYSELEVSQGAFEILDNAHVSLTDSTEVTVQGTVRLGDNAVLDMHSSKMNVTSSLRCAGLHFLCSCSCGNFAPVPEYALLCSSGVSEETCEAQCFERLGHEEVDEICTDECVVVCPTGEETSRGSVSLEGNSTSSFVHTDIFVSDGLLTLDHSHTGAMVSSFLQVTNGHVTVQELASLEISSQSIGRVLAGDIRILGSGELFITSDSLLAVDGGSVTLDGSSRSNLQDGQLSVSEGDFRVRGGASLLMASSDVSVVGGGLIAMEDDATWVQSSGSSIHMSGEGGSLSLSGSSFEMTNSRMNIDDGQVSFSSSIAAAIESSNVTVSGGDLLFSGWSISSFSNSHITVTSGSVTANESSSTILFGSEVSVAASLICEGTAELRMTGASSVIVSGSLQAYEDSWLLVTEETILDIGSSSGRAAVQLYDSAQLTVEEQSVVQVSGHLVLRDESSLSVLSMSTVIVDGGGNLFVADNSTIAITGASLLDVRSGEVACGNFATIFVSEDSELRVQDQLTFSGRSGIHLSAGNDMVVDEGGLVVFEDFVDITGAPGSELGDSGDFTNSGLVDFSHTGGNIHAPLLNRPNGRVRMGDSQFSVTSVTTQGNIQFSGSRVSAVPTVNATGAMPLLVSRQGQAQGRLQLQGDYHNAGKVQHDLEGGTLFQIEGQYLSNDDAELYILITDPENRGQGFSYISANGGAKLGGTAVICIPNKLKFKGRVDVIEFNGLKGKFDRIIYQCTDAHQVNRKANHQAFKSAHMASREPSLSWSVWSQLIDSVWAAEQPQSKSDSQLLSSGRLVELEEEVEMEGGGCTKTSLSSSSFSVLFAGCGDGGGGDGNPYDNGNTVIQWLSLSFFVLAIIAVVVISVLFVAVPPLRRLMLGSEGHRITTVRRARQSSLSGLAMASNKTASNSANSGNSSNSVNSSKSTSLSALSDVDVESSAAPQLQFGEL